MQQKILSTLKKGDQWSRQSLKKWGARGRPDLTVIQKKGGGTHPPPNGSVDDPPHLAPNCGPGNNDQSLQPTQTGNSRSLHTEHVRLPFLVQIYFTVFVHKQL